MDTFLFGDSTDKPEDWYIVHKFGAIEILLLEYLFGSIMIIVGHIDDELKTHLTTNSVGEGERVRVLPQHRRQG